MAQSKGLWSYWSATWISRSKGSGNEIEREVRFGGMRDESKNECGMTEIRWPRVGCEIKILPREWNFPILIDEMRLGFKIDFGMWDKKPENQT